MTFELTVLGNYLFRSKDLLSKAAFLRFTFRSVTRLLIGFSELCRFSGGNYSSSSWLSVRRHCDAEETSAVTLGSLSGADLASANLKS